MRARASRSLTLSSVVLSLLLSLSVSRPASGFGAQMEPELGGGSPAGALGAADPMATALEGMRAELVEIEHQRDVVWALRERSFRVMRPGDLPSDVRYPGSVLCEGTTVVYPAQPTSVALGFCGVAR